MIIETKYDIGDWLYSITRAHRTEWVPCAFCDATGFISGANNKTCICPECYGRRGDDMDLPEGKTCADCVHCNRCTLIFGHVPEDEACDFSPSRFQESKQP